jgi:hypothetical protein
MKAETKARKERMKRKLAELNQQVNKSGKKGMTTVQHNQAVLDLISKKDEPEVEIEETEEQKANRNKNLRHKHFKCECGIQVELNGEAEQSKCSKCLEKEIV